MTDCEPMSNKMFPRESSIQATVAGTMGCAVWCGTARVAVHFMRTRSGGQQGKKSSAQEGSGPQSGGKRQSGGRGAEHQPAARPATRGRRHAAGFARALRTRTVHALVYPQSTARNGATLIDGWRDGCQPDLRAHPAGARPIDAFRVGKLKAPRRVGDGWLYGGGVVWTCRKTERHVGVIARPSPRPTGVSPW
jgi:hypothetical protein